MAPPLSLSSARIIDPILSTVVRGYKHAAYVGSRLFPAVYVRTSGGQVLEFDKDAFKIYSTRRAPGSSTAVIEWGYKGKSFALVQDALNGVVPREHQRDASVVPGIDLGRGAVNRVMRSVTLNLEVDQATLATTAANYPATNKLALSGATKWTDPASKPVDDIEAAREAIRSQCGIYPNVCVMSPKAYIAARNNPSVIGRVLYGGNPATPAQVTKQALADLFNVDEVIVGEGVYVNGAGASVDIWGNNVVLAYVPSSFGTIADGGEPSYGYTYTMEGNPMTEVPYYSNDRKAWIYGVTYERAPVLSGISSGFLITGAA